MFVPVQALASASTAVGLVEERPSPASVSRSVVAPGLIEIELGDGRHFRVGSDVNLAALRRMLGGVARVIPIASSVRIWLATGHTDMRRGMPGLALLVQEGLGRDPFAGDVFVFRGRSGSLLKAVWHDGLGLSLYAKRLDRGRFIWPQTADGVVALTAGQMSYLLEGIDWRHPQQTWRPQSAG